MMYENPLFIIIQLFEFEILVLLDISSNNSNLTYII